jgi:hypothetical protein
MNIEISVNLDSVIPEMCQYEVSVFQRRSDTHQRRNPNFRRLNFSQ